MRSPRSWLYVPGDHVERLAAASERGADALIADLEDSVGPGRKQVARETVSRWLTEQPVHSQRWVRVNVDTISEDVAVVASPTMAGIVVPKAEPDRLLQADAALTEQEERLGVAIGTFAVFALIETARGLLEATAVASAARVRQVGLGEADLAGELRMRPGPDKHELRPLRLQVVVACAAVGQRAPTAPTSTDVRDVAGLRQSTQGLFRLGFRSRTAIHPSQLAVINETFTPTPEEVAEARALIDRFEASAGGVFVDQQGQLVDAAVLRSAREVLDRADPL